VRLCMHFIDLPSKIALDFNRESLSLYSHKDLWYFLCGVHGQITDVTVYVHASSHRFLSICLQVANKNSIRDSLIALWSRSPHLVEWCC
jgi:hypothetical protein